MIGAAAARLADFEPHGDLHAKLVTWRDAVWLGAPPPDARRPMPGRTHTLIARLFRRADRARATEAGQGLQAVRNELRLSEWSPRHGWQLGRLTVETGLMRRAGPLHRRTVWVQSLLAAGAIRVQVSEFMQSYANFTVGGSVSVNCHGRDVGLGPVGHSVRALQLVTADGDVLAVGPQARPELFSAAIGGCGCGAVGIITEVELNLVPNVRIQRRVTPVPLRDYAAHVRQFVLTDPTAVLHNADLLPPDFAAPVCVSGHRVGDDVALTEPERLVPRGQSHALAQSAIFVMTELPGGARLRERVVHPLLMRPPVVKWLNHEASLDVAELEPRTRAMSTYVLQEYSIPESGFLGFAQEMAQLLRRRNVEALNVSIRHSPKDRVSALPWAPGDVFSVVPHHKQRTWKRAHDEVGAWTRELTALALRHGGRDYLPYQLHATGDQFHAACPEAAQLRRTKQPVDPAGRLSNALWRKYL